MPAETVKILGINGSPRPKGNSMFLLEHAIKGAEDAGFFVQTEIYNLGGKGKSFAPCDSCFACLGNGDCHIEDSFQELRQKWLDADGIIYSVPVYHMTYPAQLRAFIDRLGNSLFGYYQMKCTKSMKVIGSITQGMHIFSGQEHTLTDLINHAFVMGGIPVSGDMWESYIGVGGWTENSEKKDAMAQLVEKGSLDAQVTVSASRAIGKRVAQFALIVNSGVRANRKMLEADGGYDAFFQHLGS
jgi:multimeric flavodoxin WrbA